MKIYLANFSKQTIGGGWSFLRTFERFLLKQDNIESVKIFHDIFDIPSWELVDIIFISGATMAKRNLIEEGKKMGKKIVLRVDNALRNSRNRNTGMSRMYDFAQMADLVIYQSNWAKNFLMPFLKKDGPVIINGVDQDIFYPIGSERPKEGEKQYIFSQFNRDETKQFFRVWYEYQMIQRDNPNAHLWIVGKFSPENLEYNFDFFMNEKYRYVGILEDPEDMAEYLRSADVFIYSYYNDACSNQLIEAICCGTKILNLEDSGGANEIGALYIAYGVKYFSAQRMCGEYIKEIKKIL